MNELVINIGAGVNDVPLNTNIPTNILTNIPTNVLPTIQNTNILPNNYADMIKDPLLNLVKDMILNLILNIPSLRNKLDNILITPDIILYDINKLLFEFRQKISNEEFEKIKKYMVEGNVKNNIVNMLITSFNNILMDDRIDVNDAPYFLQLIKNIVVYFNQITQNTESVINVQSETVLCFLYFLIKCILILTLNDEDESRAIVLLDNCFNLLSITVLPITKMKCGCFSRKSKK